MSMLVYGETDAEALGKFVPKVEELNLAINLLSSWEDVGEIIKHLENLNFLHLRYNKIPIHVIVRQVIHARQSIEYFYYANLRKLYHK